MTLIFPAATFIATTLNTTDVTIVSYVITSFGIFAAIVFGVLLSIVIGRRMGYKIVKVGKSDNSRSSNTPKDGISSISSGIEIHLKRDPSKLRKLMSEAKDGSTAIFIGTDLGTTANMTQEIKDLVRRNVRIQFYILNPEGNPLFESAEACGIIADASATTAAGVLKRLCELKQKLGEAGNNITIWKYIHSPIHSIGLVNAGTDDAIIQIDSHLYDTPAQDRPMLKISKRDAKDFFEPYMRSVDWITRNAIPHYCLKSDIQEVSEDYFFNKA